MASNSVVTEEKLKDYHDNLVLPYLNGAAHSGCLPVGTIIGVYSETAPMHFLACDGTVYNKTDYPELVQHLFSLTDTTPYEVSGDSTKFKVPDLRGEFLRGTGTNSHTNQGNGGNVGQHQDATDIIAQSLGTNLITYAVAGEARPIINYDSYHTPATNQYTQEQISSVERQITAYRTVRPTNTSVLWCIAYTSTFVDAKIDGKEVIVTNLTDGQILVYNSTTEQWENADLSGGGHEIMNEGASTALTQRETMVLQAPLFAEDDSTNEATNLSLNVDADLSGFPVPATSKPEWEHIYSTSEQVVGKYVDGKPVYEITITGTTGSSSEPDKYIAIGASIDKVVLLNTMVFDSYNQWVTFPREYGNNGSITQNFSVVTNYSHTTNPNKLRIFVQNHFDNTFLSTIRYTKTTDTASS